MVARSGGLPAAAALPPAPATARPYHRPNQRKRRKIMSWEPELEELRRRRESLKIWADATYGMFGRSPDFMNVMVAGVASAAPALCCATATTLLPLRLARPLLSRQRGAEGDAAHKKHDEAH